MGVPEQVAVETLMPTAAKLPPMLAQYLEYKANYPDALLFFQVGDFYEVFFQDAVTVSRTLNLTLTSRDKSSPNPIPMCGVPIAVIDGYAERLVAAGFSCAIVSQGAAPEKGMVPRFLERIITPGIKILGGAESAPASGYVGAVAGDPERGLSIAFSSVQSGKVLVVEGVSSHLLAVELGRLGIVEVVFPAVLNNQKIDRRLPWVRAAEVALGENRIKFRSIATERAVGSQRSLGEIAGFSVLGVSGKQAAKLLVEFIDETTVQGRIPINSFALFSEHDFVSIDVPTRRNLELIANSHDGGTTGTLFEYLDCTTSTAGQRVLKQWVVQPLRNRARIIERQQSVRYLLEEITPRQEIRALCAGIVDFERIAARIELGAVTPRELGALRDSLLRIPEIAGILSRASKKIPEFLKTLVEELQIPRLITEKLKAALVEDPPLLMHEGGIIRDGHNAEVDKLRAIQKDGHGWIAQLEAKERDACGISSLKIRFNNVIGYFFEITKANASKVPEHFIRRQSTANGDRFTTPALKELEQDVLGAEGKLVALERELFAELRKSLIVYAPELRRVGEQVSVLDVLASFAQLAERDSLTEPSVVEETELVLERAQHPILARLLGEKFIPNSLAFHFDLPRCAIVSGPNMGGKSTYLRQAALVCIMAQLGAFVPAAKAKVGIVDKIFARLGASDNLREGESTFMVEMREAANIAHSATERSLVLIDEIGRGTATADGLAIAQSILEWLVSKVKCRTLFATHFHELTSLELTYPTIKNLSVASIEGDGGVIFTHQILDGAARKSYGVEVAKLAGLPAALIKRAEVLMRQQEQLKALQGNSPQLSLFESPAPVNFQENEPPHNPKQDEFVSRCAAIKVEELSPVKAIVELESLRAEARSLREK